MVHDRIAEVTARIARRSHDGRARYLERIDRAIEKGPKRTALGCANLAHGFAACSPIDKARLRDGAVPNLAIVNAYNDMLSAHQPYERYPEVIREAAHEVGAVAQVAGGVPAMCDGVTQGEAGMELSLFSRDVIALSTAVALSHQMFDAAVYLGICDKIVPGLVIGALSFGHLPAVFVPAGPMPSGLPNDEKSRIRQLYAEGKVGRDALLEAEAQSYHSPGTCTFYGTANSNQMLMEIMGLHLPGSSFVNPNTPLRDELTRAAAKRALALTAQGNEFTPVGRLFDEKVVVNGVVGLHATGGSTNHTIHLIAMAAAAGITLTWEDLSDLAEAVPLLTRVYPNGKADVNHFHAAGGMGFLIRELISAGLLHADVKTGLGHGPRRLCGRAEARRDRHARLEGGGAPQRRRHRAARRRPPVPADRRPACADRPARPRRHQDLRRRPSATSSRRRPRCSTARKALQAAFKAGELDRDLVAVGALPGAEGERHAGAPQADAAARRAPGPRPQGRSRHRRPPVRRVGQGAGGDPRDAGGRGRRADRPHPRRRPDPRRRRDGPRRNPRRGERVGGAHAGRRRPRRLSVRRRAGAVRALPRHRRRRRQGCHHLFRDRRMTAAITTPSRTILTTAPVIPVLIIEDVASAVPLARALVAGGLKVLEITLRTPAALDATRAILGEVEGAIVGVGTVLTKDQLAAAEKAGARFAVSPGVTEKLLDARR